MKEVVSFTWQFLKLHSILETFQFAELRAILIEILLGLLSLVDKFLLNSVLLIVPLRHFEQKVFEFRHFGKCFHRVDRSQGIFGALQEVYSSDCLLFVRFELTQFDEVSPT